MSFLIYNSAVPPKIVDRPKDLVVRSGKDAKFSCRATGYPSPTIFWEMKDKKAMFPLQPNGRFFVESSGDLVISQVKEEDEGDYKCSALSSAGLADSTAKATLTVLGMKGSLVSYTVNCIFWIPPTTRTDTQGCSADLADTKLGPFDITLFDTKT